MRRGRAPPRGAPRPRPDGRPGCRHSRETRRWQVGESNAPGAGERERLFQSRIVISLVVVAACCVPSVGIAGGSLADVNYWGLVQADRDGELGTATSRRP